MEWRPIAKLKVDDLWTRPIWEWREIDGAEEVRPTMLDSIPGADGNIVHIALTEFTLANGNTLFGYCSPGDDSGLDYTQPVIIHEGSHWSLYKGNDPMLLQGKKIYPIQYKCLVPCNGVCLKQSISKKEISRNKDLWIIPSVQNIITLVIVSAIGLIIWVVIALVSGHREAWDSPTYFTVGLPLMLLISGIAGAVRPNTCWLWGIAVVIPQLFVMIISGLAVQVGASLLPVGLFIFFVFIVLCTISSCAGWLIRQIYNKFI